MSDDTWHAIVDLVLNGTFLCCKHVGRQMLTQRSGSIILTATMDALHLLPVASPEQIAPFAVYLASDESAVVTGGIFPIDSGYTAFKANLDVMGAMRVGAVPGVPPQEER